jgi:chromosome segregation ATPase
MDAAGLSVARLQDDNASLNDQVDNMREQMDQLQAKMIDAGIFVGRKILTDDASYITSYSKVRLILCGGHVRGALQESQTDLTSEALSVKASEFQTLNQRVAELKKKHSGERNELLETIDELNESLRVKSELSATLTQQLVALTGELETHREDFDQERTQYMHKLAELSEICQQVPLLEQDLANVNEQLRQSEKRLTLDQQDYDEAIEVGYDLQF